MVRPKTWGEWLADQARRRMDRRGPALAVHRLVPVLDRVAGLDVSNPRRFERVERLPTAAPAPPPEPAPLPADARDRLRDLIGPAVDTVRVRDDDDADNTARVHRADAVAIGREVHFRRGQYRPSHPAGLALIAHEATHVAAALGPGASVSRSTARGIAQEEARAAAAEARFARATAPGRPSPPSPPTVSPAQPAPAPAARQTAAAGQPPTDAALRPMAAPSDRDTPPAAASPNEIDVDDLKRSVLRDLLAQIRSDAERGA